MCTTAQYRVNYCVLNKDVISDAACVWRDLSEFNFLEIHRFPLILTTFASTGPQGDAESAKKFILQMYREQHNGRHADLYTHYTCATDTENIRVVFKAVKDTLFQNNLDKFNLR